eukprot:1165866_1
MSSSKKPRMSSIRAGSHIIPRGASKLLNQSKIKRKGTGNNSRGSGSKLMESRFMSRMKSSVVGGKYGKSGYRKKGSSKYCTVRENGDPIIYREGVDVTPLPIQIDDLDTNNKSSYTGYSGYSARKHESTCFIPLVDPIYPPMSGSQNDDNKEKENVNANTIICTEKDNEIDCIANANQFNQFIQTNPSVLDEMITIQLCETDTQILFEMPTLGISNRDTSKQERDKVIQMNQDYDNCLLKHNDKDLFTTSETQTYNPPIKDQSIHVKPPQTHAQHTQSSTFDIYDAFQNESLPQVSQPTHSFPQMVDLTSEVIDEMQNAATFKKNLMMMERAVIQNVMAPQQMLYRVHSTTGKDNTGNEFDSDDEENELKVEIDLGPVDNAPPPPPAAASTASNSPHLQLLWNYSCAECTGLSCTALDYNPLNTDLVVGGYGSWDFANKDSGKIMFWTLKNPTNPSRIYSIEDTCVVSLNFSRMHPYLLAAGLFDGNVSVYDIRVQSNDPILKSQLNSATSDSKKQNQSSSSKHTTPVWNVMWEKPNHVANTSTEQNMEDANDTNDNNEPEQIEDNNSKLHQRHKLFSIASDGIIKQWSMKKGFNSSNIMSLKRVPNLAAKRGSAIDNTIRSRQASGLCFDFPLRWNNTQYYVGTEDGIVHKCSVSYNEQVLRSYYGHTGSVHRVQCSPFDRNTFITCAADWNINIWSQHKSSPLLQLTSNSNQSVIDCCWSPFNSCVFASASDSGILSVWNLEKSKKDAIITKDTKNGIKQIMFAPNAPALLSAHANGTIQVHRLNHINTASHANDELHQMNKLNKALESKN